MVNYIIQIVRGFRLYICIHLIQRFVYAVLFCHFHYLTVCSVLKYFKKYCSKLEIPYC